MLKHKLGPHFEPEKQYLGMTGQQFSIMAGSLFGGIVIASGVNFAISNLILSVLIVITTVSTGAFFSFYRARYFKKLAIWQYWARIRYARKRTRSMRKTRIEDVIDPEKEFQGQLPGGIEDSRFGKRIIDLLSDTNEIKY